MTFTECPELTFRSESFASSMYNEADYSPVGSRHTSTLLFFRSRTTHFEQRSNLDFLILYIYQQKKKSVVIEKIERKSPNDVNEYGLIEGYAWLNHVHLEI